MDKHEEKSIVLTEDEVTEFLDFIDNHEDYLDSGLDVFHTDNHSNW